jgi:hypothetical protein
LAESLPGNRHCQAALSEGRVGAPIKISTEVISSIDGIQKDIAEDGGKA